MGCLEREKGGGKERERDKGREGGKERSVRKKVPQLLRLAVTHLPHLPPFKFNIFKPFKQLRPFKPFTRNKDRVKARPRK